MTKQTEEALKMAYDWLNEYAPPEVVQACKEALEQPAQEPVAWMSGGGVLTKLKSEAQLWITKGGTAIPLYTHPAPSWQGLNDDEITKVFDDIGVSTTNRKIYCTIEQALRIKNAL